VPGRAGAFAGALAAEPLAQPRGACQTADLPVEAVRRGHFRVRDQRGPARLSVTNDGMAEAVRRLKQRLAAG